MQGIANHPGVALREPGPSCEEFPAPFKIAA